MLFLKDPEHDLTLQMSLTDNKVFGYEMWQVKVLNPLQ